MTEFTNLVNTIKELTIHEKINATSWYGGWVDICKKKQLEDPKLFKKYWDGPVEIRQLKGGSWD